jgi:hypothetical protein
MKKANDQNEDVAVMEQQNGLVPHQTGTAIAKANPHEGIVTVVDMDHEFPDMSSDVERVPLDLASEYWTPEATGETKRLIFSHFSTSLVPDKYGPSKGLNGEMVELETANFFEKAGDEVKAVRQSSKVLLGTLKGHNIQRGTLLEIVFVGKKRLNNGNTGDSWAVFPLRMLPKK